MNNVPVWGLCIALVSSTHTWSGLECGEPGDEEGAEASPTTERAVWTREVKLVAPPLRRGEVWVFELDPNGHLRSSFVTSRAQAQVGMNPSTGVVTLALEATERSLVLRSGIDPGDVGAPRQFLPWRLVVLASRLGTSLKSGADAEETSRESPMAMPLGWRRSNGRTSV